jgi:hypothetical protein
MRDSVRYGGPTGTSKAISLLSGDHAGGAFVIPSCSASMRCPEPSGRITPRLAYPRTKAIHRPSGDHAACSSPFAGGSLVNGLETPEVTDTTEIPRLRRSSSANADPLGFHDGSFPSVSSLGTARSILSKRTPEQLMSKASWRPSGDQFGASPRASRFSPVPSASIASMLRTSRGLQRPSAYPDV